MTADRGRIATTDACPNVEVPAPLIGPWLRQQRFESGISLRELARRLDVSASLVSQIETGKVRPSARTLYSIVSEMGLSLDETFELANRDGRPRGVDPHGGAGAGRARGTVRPSRAGSGSGEGTPQRRVIESEADVRWERLAAWDDPDLEFMIAVYGAGGSSSVDGKLKRHSGREFGLVLSGTLSVTVGFDDHVLEPGASISFQSTTPHRLRYDSSADARAIWVTLGRHGANAAGPGRGGP